MRRLLATVAALAIAASPVAANASFAPAWAVDLTATAVYSESGSGWQVAFTATDPQSRLITGPTANSSTEISVDFEVLYCARAYNGSTSPNGGADCTDYSGQSAGKVGNVGASNNGSIAKTDVFPSHNNSMLADKPFTYAVVSFRNHLSDRIQVVMNLELPGSRFENFGPRNSADERSTTDMDPGISFAGPLITSATGRTADEDTAGTLRFNGKRLHQVTGATIGGIEVTVTSATRSALLLDFDALPAGKHDVVLTTKAGAKTTLRGFVTVR